CTPLASLDSAKVGGGIPVPSLSGPDSCGTASNQIVAVKTRNGNKKAGKLKIKSRGTAPQGTHPRVDRDKYILICQPRVGACPTTTTSTAPSTSSSTTSSSTSSTSTSTSSSSTTAIVTTTSTSSTTSTTLPLCGNGSVDPGEACDDGNVVDGD